ncbi:MAG TPA: HNH endonuclease [Candidatus Dormibacteraeota bacterium]|nr:HNH endonuclease [Candidatus Dormibacteraeota bacterium]
MGRTRRTFTPAQWKALALRDGGCSLCGRPVAWTAGHHLEHCIDGGATSVENGALLCHRWHVRVHEGGSRLVRRPDLDGRPRSAATLVRHRRAERVHDPVRDVYTTAKGARSAGKSS